MVYFPLVSPNTKRAFQWWVAQPPINWLYTSRFFSGDGCWQLAIAGRFTWGSQFGQECCICKLAHFAWDQLGKGRASIKDGRSQQENGGKSKKKTGSDLSDRINSPTEMDISHQKKIEIGMSLYHENLWAEPARSSSWISGSWWSNQRTCILWWLYIVFSICGARWFMQLVTECNCYFVL